MQGQEFKTHDGNQPVNMTKQMHGVHCNSKPQYRPENETLTHQLATKPAIPSDSHENPHPDHRCYLKPTLHKQNRKTRDTEHTADEPYLGPLGNSREGMRNTLTRQDVQNANAISKIVNTVIIHYEFEFPN